MQSAPPLRKEVNNTLCLDELTWPFTSVSPPWLTLIKIQFAHTAERMLTAEAGLHNARISFRIFSSEFLARRSFFLWCWRSRASRSTTITSTNTTTTLRHFLWETDQAWIIGSFSLANSTKNVSNHWSIGTGPPKLFLALRWPQRYRGNHRFTDWVRKRCSS